jgi:thiamine pyrophosphate-dependent acetolactate synthase large subunit-like protein
MVEAQRLHAKEPSMPRNQITGRSAFLALLKDEGVSHLFGNPGTTELPIMHALKDYPELTYVMAMQESLVVAMADGFGRASGQLTACNVHVAPGLGNAMGSLYNAKFTGTPMILTAGQQEQDRPAPGQMGDRGDAPRGLAQDCTPCCESGDDATDRSSVHLTAGRHPEYGVWHRSRQRHARR